MKRKTKYHSLNLDLQLRVKDLERKIEEMKVQLAFREQLKNDSMQRYVNESIAAWNSAIRSCGGAKKDETPAQYQARLVAANRKD